ncbi:MAG: hypothetical protein RBR87_14505 [Bacteroidales bacterium]|nr:hypothetical protein [Bacteroidales bacterium]
MEKFNNRLLKTSVKHLKTKSLKPSIIKTYADNIEFFANDFLLYEELMPVEKGFSEVSVPPTPSFRPRLPCSAAHPLFGIILQALPAQRELP